MEHWAKMGVNCNSKMGANCNCKMGVNCTCFCSLFVIKDIVRRILKYFLKFCVVLRQLCFKHLEFTTSVLLAG